MYLRKKPKGQLVDSNINIFNLIKKNKLEEKKVKKQTFYLVAATVSAVAISGFLISQ